MSTNSSHQQSYLREGTLHLVYSVELFPYIFHSPVTGLLTGSFVHQWRDVGKFLFGADRVDIQNVPFDSFASDDSEIFDGVFGDVDKGKYLTPIEGRSLGYGRDRRLVPSLPYYHDQYSFYESVHDAHKETSHLINFTVFSTPALVLIVFLLAVVHLLEAVMKMTMETLPLYSILYHVASAFFIAGTTLIIFYHQAAFAGNTAVPITTTTTFPEMIHGLRSGIRRLVVEPGAGFEQNVKAFALGSPNSTNIEILQSGEGRVRSVCASPRTVGLLSRIEELAVTEVEEPCYLRSYELSPVDGKPVPDANLFAENAFYLLFSRTASRRVDRERANQAVLRIFRDDQRSSAWMLRYAKTYYPRQAEPLNYSAFTFGQFLTIIYAALPFYAICIASIALEFIHSRFGTRSLCWLKNKLIPENPHDQVWPGFSS